MITTFCVVNIPGLSELAPEIPYVSAQILLDGANNTFFGLIRGVEVDEVHMGQRAKVRRTIRDCRAVRKAHPSIAAFTARRPLARRIRFARGRL